MKRMNGWLGSCLAWGAAAAIAGASTLAYAVHDTTTFELDRNAVDQSSPLTNPPDDWDTVNLPPLPNGGGHSFVHTGVISDPTPESSIFTSGGSKDNNDISQWRWKNASNILDKDNITNAYAAAYNVGGHLVIYFGLDRLSNDGSAQVGFWFLKNTVTLNGTGNSGGGDSFNGVHANGDILVQSNFSQGGVISTVTVYEWQNGNLLQIATGGDCVPGSAGDSVCATVNQDADPSSNVAPWPYTPKPNVGSPGFFPHGTFFEGGIDLTALGLTDACFSTFLAETRSSTPFDSTLKDFVGPRKFDTCSVKVTKFCTNPRLSADQTKITYDIGGTVTAQGFGGNLFDVALSDSPAADGAFQVVDCTTKTPTGSNFPLDTLNGDACYKNTMTVPLKDNGVSDTVSVVAYTEDNQQGTKLSGDSGLITCPKLQVSPTLKVTKFCKTSVAVSGVNVVAKVTVSGQVCNTGQATDGNITNVIVDDQAITTSPDPLVNGITLAPQACQSYTGTYFPTVANDANGNPTDCPSLVVFKDSVKATAKDILGADVAPDFDGAACPLCPGGDCSGPPSP